MVKMLATMLDHGCPTMVFIMVFRILPNIQYILFFSGAQFIKKLKLIYIISMVDHGQ